MALLDGEIRLTRGAVRVALQIHIAGVGARAGLVDLLDGDLDVAAGLRLCHLIGRQGVLGLLADVDVAGCQGPPTLVHDVSRDLLVVDEVGVGGIIGVDFIY